MRIFLPDDNHSMFFDNTYQGGNTQTAPIVADNADVNVLPSQDIAQHMDSCGYCLGLDLKGGTIPPAVGRAQRRWKTNFVKNDVEAVLAWTLLEQNGDLKLAGIFVRKSARC